MRAKPGNRYEVMTLIKVMLEKTQSEEGLPVYLFHTAVGRIGKISCVFRTTDIRCSDKLAQRGPFRELEIWLGRSESREAGVAHSSSSKGDVQDQRPRPGRVSRASPVNDRRLAPPSNDPPPRVLRRHHLSTSPVDGISLGSNRKQPGNALRLDDDLTMAFSLPHEIRLVCDPKEDTATAVLATACSRCTCPKYSESACACFCLEPLLGQLAVGVAGKRIRCDSLPSVAVRAQQGG